MLQAVEAQPRGEIVTIQPCLNIVISTAHLVLNTLVLPANSLIMTITSVDQ